MNKERLRIITVIGVVAGILLLYLYSLHLDPEKVSISELEDYEGRYVIVSGKVVEVNERSGGTTLTLSEDNATARVFLDSNDENLQVGDRVEVMGKVSSYRGGYSISVSGRGTLKVLDRWERDLLTLPALSENPWGYVGQNVNVSCKIDSKRYEKGNYSYFYVADSEVEDYSLVVYIYDLDVQHLPEGEAVFLNARVEYNPERMSFNCVMDSPEHHLWLDRMAGFE
ncbi:MAG: hypothetical protein KAU14_09010 [Thermoplasmata archaeon]|nr:hypothetical protein [Thermoplasmata archaeon]